MMDDEEDIREQLEKLATVEDKEKPMSVSNICISPSTLLLSLVYTDSSRLLFRRHSRRSSYPDPVISGKVKPSNLSPDDRCKISHFGQTLLRQDYDTITQSTYQER